MEGKANIRVAIWELSLISGLHFNYLYKHLSRGNVLQLYKYFLIVIKAIIILPNLGRVTGP